MRYIFSLDLEAFVTFCIAQNEKNKISPIPKAKIFARDSLVSNTP